MRIARLIATGLPILAAVLLTAVDPGLVRAADPEPSKKDSRVEARPKDATLTTSVTPREARPGETVNFSVTAKLAPGWHIYGFSKVQPANGPKVTQFDLFDPAGLTVKGEWTPNPAPTPKKEEAFPDLPFVEIHEGEVTWSIAMVVPAGTVPGEKSVRVQASYQICSDQTCSFPGRWTLPAATMTVVAADAPKRDAAVSKTAADAAPLKPLKKDSRPIARPKGVTLSSSVVPAEARPGETVTYQVTAKVAPGTTWHIYKYAKVDPGNGPMLTTFDFFDPAGLIPKGDWTASKEPIKKKEAVFPDVPFLEFYEDEVTWNLTLTVPLDATPGKKTLRCQAGYQVCDDKSCSQPGQWTLDDVALTILSVGTVVEAPKPIAATPVPVTPPSEVAPVQAPKSDVEAKAALGLLPFLATCALGGLLALVMPCVWPMIPITVNFFVKQGQKKQGNATGLAITYCLAIIGVFTGVGVLFSIFFGAASLSKLANNPWVNFGVAGLFLAFGLSLLGLFEIRLPNFLLNASAQGEGKGGLVGVMFMALTLTITSFTCTFPVVGGLLVMAAGGSYLYPVIGLATFASVIALPFFLLALSPGLISKMPKSGDWMNTVKVVGGLIEIGAAFKFINTAETAFVVPSEAIFNAYAVLAIWVVLALVCGIYLLGLFRTDHDQEAIKVGPGRIMLGSLFLFMSLFMAPALFGRPPQSRLWYLVVGLLPADAGDLKAPVVGGPMIAGGTEVEATSKDPKVAPREQRNVHGVAWGMSYEAAVEESKAKGKPILIDFTGVNCANCRLMEQEVLPRPEVIKMLGEFVTVQLYTDYVPIKSLSAKDRETLAEANLEREVTLVKESTNPFYVVVNADETVLATKGGKVPTAEFLDFLRKGLAKHQGAEKVARNGGAVR